MDYQELERIILEEVKKAMAEQDRNQQTLLPPNQQETLDPNACNGPSCTMPQTGPANPAPTQPPKKDIDPNRPAVLMLFSCAKEKWDVLSKSFKLWHDEGIQIEAVISPTSCDMYSVDELATLGMGFIDQPAKIRSLMMDMSEYTAVFCPSMSRNFASKLALGITDNTVLNLALTALAQKLPVFASNDGMAPSGCIACGNNVPGIREILQKYQKQLEKMGMTLLPADDAVKQFYQVITNKADSRDENLITRLVTEEEAAQMKGPVVKVIRGGLITPLAMESFIKRGIEVVIVPQD
ncbi:hypothetical protein GF373_09805 [bacterium]|nr:hypothetical protein [bacterium]